MKREENFMPTNDKRLLIFSMFFFFIVTLIGIEKVLNLIEDNSIKTIYFEVFCLLLPAIIYCKKFFIISDIAKHYNNKRINILLISILSFLFCINLYLFFLTYKNNGINFDATSLLEFIKLYFIICILSCICEEFFFRGIVLNQIRPIGKYMSIIGSSIMFSLYHIDFNKYLMMLLLGLLIGFIYTKSNSLILSILIHSLYNSITFFVILLAGSNQFSQVSLIYRTFLINTDGNTFKFINLAFAFLCLLFAILSLIYWRVKHKVITRKFNGITLLAYLLPSIVVVYALSLYQMFKY